MLPLKAGEFEGLWEVASHYGVGDGQLWAGGHMLTARYYRPQDRPELPFEVAKLAEASDNDVIRFAKQWGMLGYLPLAHAKRVGALLALGPQVEFEPVTGNGEPVAWIRQQGRRLWLSVRLTDAVVRGDADAAATAIRHFFDMEFAADQWATAQWAWRAIFRSQFFIKDDPAERHPIERAVAGMPLDVARLMLDQFVNEGLTGIEPQLEWDGGPLIRFRFHGMVQIAYLHVAHLLVGRSQVDYCEECGKPFNKTDGRQRFCPRGPFETASRCGYRHRYGKKPRSEWRTGAKKGDQA